MQQYLLKDKEGSEAAAEGVSEDTPVTDEESSETAEQETPEIKVRLTQPSVYIYYITLVLPLEFLKKKKATLGHHLSNSNQYQTLDKDNFVLSCAPKLVDKWLGTA